MSFENLEITQFTPHFKLTKSTTFGELETVLNDGLKFAYDLDCITAIDFITGDFEFFDSELEAVEHYASENGLIESERELSERFDDMIDELNSDCSCAIDTDDGPMMREEFNNYSDSLCKDGELHGEQYSEYCYVGKYDID